MKTPFLSSDPDRPTITLEEVLRNNRFAVLATLHDPPRKQPKEVADTRFLYHVQLGKENIVADVVPAGLDALEGSAGSSSTSTTTFFGQCYNCHYRAHSQKHCPLRRCPHCGLFGHSNLICPTHPPRDATPEMS